MAIFNSYVKLPEGTHHSASLLGLETSNHPPPASSFGAFSAAWCSISSCGGRLRLNDGRLGRNAELMAQQQEFDSFTPIIYI